MTKKQMIKGSAYIFSSVFNEIGNHRPCKLKIKNENQRILRGLCHDYLCEIFEKKFPCASKGKTYLAMRVIEYDTLNGKYEKENETHIGERHNITEGKGDPKIRMIMSH